MGQRWKLPDFLSQDDPVVTLIAGDGITLDAEEVDAQGIEVTISGLPGAGQEVATFSKAGTLTVGAGTGRYLMPAAGFIVGVGAAINTAPTGASLIVDVNRNGSTIFTTQAHRPTIVASAFATAGPAIPDVPNFSAGDYLSVDIDQVGSTVAGADLVVQVTYMLSTTPGGGGGGGSTQAGPPTINAADYGTDPSGTVDSSAAINAAIAALPVTGGTVYIGPGNFKCTSTINIGNGSASGVSTTTGVQLIGSASAAGICVLTGVPGPSGFGGACRLFSGAAVDMLHINGPLQGWGVHNIDFDGAGTGTKGIVETACQAGDSSGCIIRGFTNCGQQTTALAEAGALASVAGNHMHNRYSNWVVEVPKVNQAIGIQCLGNGVNTSTNSCFDIWDHLVLVFHAVPSTGFTMFGIYLQSCDTQHFRNVEYYNTTATGSGVCAAVEFDYTGENTNMPVDCLIERVDFATTSACIFKNGSPSGAATNNIIFVGKANGSPSNPALAGLNWGVTAANP